jgi:hypothetical protein
LNKEIKSDITNENKIIIGCIQSYCISESFVNFYLINSNMIFLYEAMFTFEGIGIVLPLENKMKTPKGMPGWTGVLNTGMILVKRSTKMSTKIDLTNDAKTTNFPFISMERCWKARGKLG